MPEHQPDFAVIRTVSGRRSEIDARRVRYAPELKYASLPVEQALPTTLTASVTASVTYTFGSADTPSSAGSEVKDQALLTTQADPRVSAATPALRFQHSPKTTTQNTGTSHENSQFTAASIGGSAEATPMALPPTARIATRVARLTSASVASGTAAERCRR